MAQLSLDISVQSTPRGSNWETIRLRLKEQILYEKDLCKYMILEIVGYSLEENKLIYCIVKMLLK